MKTIYTRLKLLIPVFITGLALNFYGCSNLQHHDDAIRIKEEYAAKYTENPYTKTKRNGSALRGTIIAVNKVTKPNSCPITDTTTFSTKATIVFLDSMSVKDDQVELIPMEHVYTASEKFGKGGEIVDFPDQINIFENYNSSIEFQCLREVPVDSTFIDPCIESCGCRGLSLDLDIPMPEIQFQCVKRNYPWYFVELRSGYAVYSDKVSTEKEKGRDSYFGEIAAGFRFGQYRNWGLGLALAYPIKAYNSYTEEDVSRPVVMLHGRWQSTEDLFGLCFKPFIYGQFGITVDRFSMDLTNLCFNNDCKEKVNDSPGIDVSLPLSYGFGIGLEFPLFSFLDIAADVGYRSVSFGEIVNGINGLDNVPTNRRINMFVMRLGITF